MGITDLCQKSPQNRFEQPDSVEIPLPNLENNLSVKLAQQAVGKIEMPEKSPFLLQKPESQSSSVSLVTTSLRDLTKECRTLEELKALMLSFEGCPLKKFATNLVFADGNPKSSLMIVGEAPGADEDKQGVPFVGTSGKLLDRMLETVGILRNKNAYISNIVPWRPPGNRPPTTQEIAQCLPLIERHIELVNPKVLLLLGGVALKSLWQTAEGIMKVRGTWRSYTSSGLENPLLSTVTYHPAFLLRSPSQKAQVWRDLLALSQKITSFEGK